MLSPQAPSRLAGGPAEEGVGEQFVARDDARVVRPPREELGQLGGVVVSVGVVEHLAVQLHALRHLYLGELRPHDDGTISLSGSMCYWFSFSGLSGKCDLSGYDSLSQYCH